MEGLREAVPASPARSSVLVPRYNQVMDALEAWLQAAKRPAPGDKGHGFEEVVEALPRFVYYSN